MLSRRSHTRQASLRIIDQPLINVERGVAPVVIFSGGAVHSQRYEIFLLAYLASCRFGLPRDRILLDPCARHTHENLRNSGGLLRLIGGRQAYVVTDDLKIAVEGQGI